MGQRVADHFGQESDALQSPFVPRMLVRSQSEREYTGHLAVVLKGHGGYRFDSEVIGQFSLVEGFRR